MLVSNYNYKTVELNTRFWMFPLFSGSKHQEILNTMAADGWELVSSSPVGVNNFLEKLVLTFRKSVD